MHSSQAFHSCYAAFCFSAGSASGKNSPDVTVLVFLLCSGVTAELHSFSFGYATAQTRQYLQIDKHGKKKKNVAEQKAIDNF